jgi:hypothetical protein
MESKKPAHAGFFVGFFRVLFIGSFLSGAFYRELFIGSFLSGAFYCGF